jgi:hypothetical protein
LKKLRKTFGYWLQCEHTDKLSFSVSFGHIVSKK